MQVTSLGLVALGGALGATLRFVVADVVGRSAGAAFPWGTIAVNLVGCLAMGVAVGLATSGSVAEPARLFVVPGLLGGFTTFSAFGFEAHTLVSQGRVAASVAYVSTSVFGGILLFALGLGLSRSVAR